MPQRARKPPPGGPYKPVRERIREFREKKRAEGQYLIPELARLSPLVLAYLRANGQWKLPPHLEIIDERLRDIAAHPNRRLIVSLHPRAGKSELISRAYPAWYLGNHPDNKVILASHEKPIAENWARQARQILIDYGQQVFGLKVTDRNGPAEWWRIDGHEGYMYACGTGSSVIGKGADLGVIDDPVKGAEQMRSPVQREHAKEWYRSEYRPRLQSSASVVMVLSRWNEDDLAGWLMSEGERDGEHWEYLRIPAIAEEPDRDDPFYQPDPLGREPGVAMWPEMFPAETLEAVRRSVGSYWWNAQYQGRPTGQEGGEFDRAGVRWYSGNLAEGTFELQHPRDGQHIEIERVPERLCGRMTCVDLAISEKETADYTVSLAWALLPGGGIVILDVLRKRLKGGTHVEEITRHADAWECDYVGIEAVQFQTDVVTRAIRAGLPAKKLEPQGHDKLVRAQTATNMWNAGMVFIPRTASWASGFIDEVCSFPVGSHDDQVDALAYACIEAARLTRDQRAVAPGGITRVSPWANRPRPEPMVQPRMR